MGRVDEGVVGDEVGTIAELDRRMAHFLDFKVCRFFVISGVGEKLRPAHDVCILATRDRK